MDVVRILQLTDLHVFAEPGTCLKGIPTRESLQEVVRWIREHEGRFDHVIITGDHTHDERPESYQAVRDILSPWLDQLWQVPGNHDDREVLRSVFTAVNHGQDSPTQSRPDAFIQFRFQTGNWLCIGLDTHLPGEVSGLIREEQVTQLKSDLQNSPATRVALFFHHPPVDVNSVWMDLIGLAGRELLQNVVQEDPRIRLICCGHVHHELETTLHQTLVVTTPSTGIQFDPQGTHPTFAAAAPGYRIIEFRGDDLTTRVGRLPHVRYVPE
ncbi:MAG: metallophosphoesterase [Planctomycetaceae bacterium]